MCGREEGRGWWEKGRKKRALTIFLTTNVRFILLK